MIDMQMNSLENFKNLLKLNAIIFFLYLAASLLAGFYSFSLIKMVAGLTVFLVVGFDCAVAIKKATQANLDFVELLLLSFVISLFFIPLLIYLVYKFSGSLNEWINIFIYFLVAVASLSYIFKRK